MKDAEFTIEQGLRDIYYNPRTGYQSMERLYQKAKEDGLNVSRRVVRDWLKTQDTYTRYKPIVRKHKIQRAFVKDLADQVQMDLIDMGKYKNKNKGYYWILTAVEILSRTAFTVPVYRKDTKNMTAAVGKLLEEFKERFGQHPKIAQFDEGKEFYNVGVKSLLKDHDIHYFSTNSDRKAAIVERFNRTLKTSMWKYFHNEGTHNSVDVLDKLTDNYNHTKHSSILMKPADVNKSNKDQVDDDGRHGDESILVPDGSNPDFNRVDAGGSERTITKGNRGVIRGRLIDIKKRFLKAIFGVTIHKGDGPNSQILYDKMGITLDRNNEFGGALYRGEKILVMKDGKIEYSVSKRLQPKVKEFKELLEKAKKEHKETPAAQVEEQMEANGLGTSEEHTDSVLEETNEAIGERISELRDEILSNPDITENDRRELDGTFSPDEYRELGGVAHEDILKLTGDKETDKKIIDGKLEGYRLNAKHWKELAEKEEEGGERRIAFELAEQTSELQGDRLRLLTGQRLKSKEALEIMKKVIENNDLTRFERFKKWARENLLELSAVSISIAGILTTVIMAGRNAIKRGAQAVSKFGKAVANIAKKFGPVLTAIGTLISKVLTLGAQGILFLAQNLWILVLALTYFIYNEYVSRRRR